MLERGRLRMTTNYNIICPSFTSLPSFEMVLYDYLEDKLNNLTNGKLTLLKSHYSEMSYDSQIDPVIQHRQTDYTLQHTYIKQAYTHNLILKLCLDFKEDLLHVFFTPSEATQGYQHKSVPLNNLLEEYTQDKAKYLFREATHIVDGLINSLLSVPRGVKLQPSVYSHHLFHGDTTFSVNSVLDQDVMEYKQYTSKETLIIRRLNNNPHHLAIYLQGNNRYFNDIYQITPPYEPQDVWNKLEEIRRS